MAVHRLTREQRFPQPPELVWPVFADAANLQAITPEFLHFQILTELPVELVAGARLAYRIRLFGLPIRWDTEITEVVDGERFVDVQRRGPYRVWEHTHLFEADGHGGTRMTDHVDYALAGGPLAEPVRRLWVARTLERIFDHRAAVAPELVARCSAATASEVSG